MCKHSLRANSPLSNVGDQFPTDQSEQVLLALLLAHHGTRQNEGQNRQAFQRAVDARVVLEHRTHQNIGAQKVDQKSKLVDQSLPVPVQNHERYRLAGYRSYKGPVNRIETARENSSSLACHHAGETHKNDDSQHEPMHSEQIELLP